MEVQQDFKDLLALFNAHNVRYVIVGSYALAFHGAPRYTGDIDILVEPDPKNAQRIINALKEFGFESPDLTNTDFEKPDNVIQLGVPPVRIDIMTSLTGISWQQVDSGKSPGTYSDIQVYYIGRNEFITNKKATDRKKDKADLEALGDD